MWVTLDRLPMDPIFERGFKREYKSPFFAGIIDVEVRELFFYITMDLTHRGDYGWTFGWYIPLRDDIQYPGEGRGCYIMLESVG